MMQQCLPLSAADHHNAGAHETLRTGELLCAISSNSVKQGFFRNATKGFLQKYNQRVSAEMQQMGFPTEINKKRVSSEMQQKDLFRNATKETKRDFDKNQTKKISTWSMRILRSR
jgi:hypothetical protein